MIGKVPETEKIHDYIEESMVGHKLLFAQKNLP
jgi:hypothetical protein